MTVTTVRKQIPREILEDIEWFEGVVARFKGGELSDGEFTPQRLKLGVYGQRQGPGIQMLRTKIPYGGLTADQLEAFADAADNFSTGKAHVTTRQNIQIHFIKLDNVATVLRDLGEEGIMSREACGNVIRNITGCHLAGVCPFEAFDITPYAHAVTFHFLRRTEFQKLPRKFKISFTACPPGCRSCRTCGIPHIHDIGVVGKFLHGKRVFELWVGGGLGNSPRFAELLEEFTPEDELARTIEAVLLVFDRNGNRNNKMRARMKFVLDKLGFEKFRELVFVERDKLEKVELTLPPLKESPGASNGTYHPSEPGYEDWKRANVVPQKQFGYSAVYVPLPVGDLTSEQLRALARVSRRYASQGVRTTVTQGFVLRWVTNGNLPLVHGELKRAGLDNPDSGTLKDITSCPGASTCNLAFTHSKNLGTVLREELEKYPELVDAAGNLSVKISGCPNACGQHHIADIGFYGMNGIVGNVNVPVYNVLVGGGITAGTTSFGLALGKVPARLVPEAFIRIVKFYVGNRQEGETFHDFVTRIGQPRFVTLITDLLVLWMKDVPESLRRDLLTVELYAPKIMKGECAK